MSLTDPGILRFGAEREPVVVIDDFADDVGRLHDMALKADYEPAGHHYPGVRAPAPAAYLQARGELLARVLADVFGFGAGADLIECSFSLVATPPERLTPIQRLPHFDGTSPGRLALLHYLCPEAAGGTAFYRHRATGFETITDARLPGYDAALRREVARAGLPPPDYVTGSTAQFERIGAVEARYNRMVIYRGITLHSGDIRQPERIGTDPATARLTVNTFLAAR